MTTKNGFDGLSIADCSGRTLAMEKSSLKISERVKPPNAMRCRTLGIATKIIAMTTDIRRKTILHELVRSAVKIGCSITRPARAGTNEG
jgi:hypothetical protein